MISNERHQRQPLAGSAYSEYEQSYPVLLSIRFRNLVIERVIFLKYNKDIDNWSWRNSGTLWMGAWEAINLVNGKYVS